MIRPRRKTAQRPSPEATRGEGRARAIRRCGWVAVVLAGAVAAATPALAAAPVVRGRPAATPVARSVPRATPARAAGSSAVRAPSPAAARRSLIPPRAPRTWAEATRPRVIASGILAGARATAAERLLARAPGSTQSYPMQIASYPRQGETRIPPNATLYIVFDQPTLKHAIVSVADLSAPGLPLLNLRALTWSAAGDTVFIQPLDPMAFGHYHGMKLNTVQGVDSSYAPDNIYPIVYFTVIARANLEPITSQSANTTLSLSPGVPTPAGVTVRETAGTAVQFTSESATFLDGGGAPLDSATERIPIGVPRSGIGDLRIPVTLPRSVAASAPGGHLSVRLAFYGVDETGLPMTYAVTLPLVAGPELASTAVIQSAVLEWPLEGAAIAAGDTLLPRAVVTGTGTGPFRGAFWLDGELLAIEEGYLDAGRPATVTMRGPIPTRRLGEHRLQFVVEDAPGVAARPVTFLCVPPPHGITLTPARNGTLPPVSAAAGPPGRLTVSATVLGTGASKFRQQNGSGVAWGLGSARYDLGHGAALEANASMRLRADEPSNGSARPEQVGVRLSAPHGSLAWGDAAPALAGSTSLFMSSVPRRAAQARYAAGGLGVVQGYVAVESRPVSAGGAADLTRTDIYAGRITRAFARDRVSVSAYGGYAHVDVPPDSSTVLAGLSPPTANATTSHSVYGGIGRARLYGDWFLTAEAAAVHYRSVGGTGPADPASNPVSGRTRTGWRSELAGTVAGVKTALQGFRYQPDMATAMNPYALSNRVGGAADASRGLGPWRFSAGFRSEQPAERVGEMPTVRTNQLRFSGTLALNQSSSVTPAFIRTTQRGAATDYTENRFQGAFTRAEPGGGRTTARLDAATYRDSKVANARRRLYSGSVVSTVRHGSGATSTLTLGYEEDYHEDLDKTDRTIQGTFETRWEAVPGRVLITPYFGGSSRDYEAVGTKETRFGGRLQVAFLRFANLGENALAMTGRVERVNLKLPVDSHQTDAGVEIIWGQRFDW